MIRKGNGTIMYICRLPHLKNCMNVLADVCITILYFRVGDKWVVRIIAFE
jgi:hypothetical protein